MEGEPMHISSRQTAPREANKPADGLDVATIRKDFPTLNNPGADVYLDSVASSLTPYSVIDAMTEYYTRYRANVHRGTYDLSMQASEYYERALRNVAQFIGASPQEIVFTSNATASINNVALTLDFKPGDEIVVSSMEHTSNLIPWARLAFKHGVKLRFYSPGKSGRFDLEDFARLLNEKTKLVALTYVSNVLGCVVPVHDVAALCRERQILYLVDACQAAPHLSIDVHSLGCDFMAFSGHKMLGPTGIGVLYIREALAERLIPAMLGGGTIATNACRCPSLDSCGLQYVSFNELPYKWQAGTPPIAEALGLSAAVDYLQSVGLAKIEAHGRELTYRATEGLKAIRGVEIFGPLDPADRQSIVSFNIADIPPGEVGRMLNERFKIAVRAGDHCALAYFRELNIPGETWGNVRASFYLYNTHEEVDRLLSAVESIADTCLD
jgi:cysteine desulfurase / selenocysteine lyase